MAEWNSYEEQRRRQMEKNRRKVEELRLHHLSAVVRQAAARPKPKPKRKAPGPGELRRSGRVAGLPEQPNYLEGAKQRDYRGVYEAYAVSKGLADEERAAGAAKQKAEELKRRIHGIRCPAFVKPMAHDCASRATVMTIPQHFIEHLPSQDEAVVLVDEADDEFHMLYKYNARHQFLSKGWRGFAAQHDLADGDCLIFQLTERTKFKVYVLEQAQTMKATKLPMALRMKSNENVFFQYIVRSEQAYMEYTRQEVMAWNARVATVTDHSSRMMKLVFDSMATGTVPVIEPQPPPAGPQPVLPTFEEFLAQHS